MAPPPPPDKQVSIFRRRLPDSQIARHSPEGRRRFARAMCAGYAESFFPLMSQFATQAEPAFCGLTTLSIILNALEVDPGRVWKGPWRFFAEELLDCCLPLDEVKRTGISLPHFVCLAHCNGGRPEVYQPETDGKRMRTAKKLDLATFRDLIALSSASSGTLLALSYSRATLGQTGEGHFSPLAAYDPETDSVLILDTARFKYPPHFCDLSSLFESTLPADKATGFPRGLVVLRKNDVFKREGKSCGGCSANQTPSAPVFVVRRTGKRAEPGDLGLRLAMRDYVLDIARIEFMDLADLVNHMMEGWEARIAPLLSCKVACGRMNDPDARVVVSSLEASTLSGLIRQREEGFVRRAEGEELAASVAVVAAAAVVVRDRCESPNREHLQVLVNDFQPAACSEVMRLANMVEGIFLAL